MASRQELNVLVYSDNRETRAEVMNAVGRRVARDWPPINWTEAATWQGAYMKVEENEFDLLILDAETPKLGGIGFGKMIRDELDENMPLVVLIGRPQDEWLARVSKPNAILPYPVNARELHEAVKEILAKKIAA